jgi:hypothetical protein
MGLILYYLGVLRLFLGVLAAIYGIAQSIPSSLPRAGSDEAMKHGVVPAWNEHTGHE